MSDWDRFINTDEARIVDDVCTSLHAVGSASGGIHDCDGDCKETTSLLASGSGGTRVCDCGSSSTHRHTRDFKYKGLVYTYSIIISGIIILILAIVYVSVCGVN